MLASLVIPDSVVTFLIDLVMCQACSWFGFWMGRIAERRDAAKRSQ